MSRAESHQCRVGRQAGKHMVDESTATACDEMGEAGTSASRMSAVIKPQKLGSGDEMVFKQNI